MIRGLVAIYNERLVAYGSNSEPLNPSEVIMAIGCLLGAHMPSCAAMLTVMGADAFPEETWFVEQIATAMSKAEPYD
jgi:hypothetical protein